MAHSYGNYILSDSTVQQSPQLGLIVQCPNCASRFCVPFLDRFNNSPTFTHQKYDQQFIQYPNPQNSVRRQYVSHHAINMDDTIVHWVRDILIDILNSDVCKYGITIPNLMVLLKRSCENYNIMLPSSIMDDFEEFLHCEMIDYVEIQDDLCRYHRPMLSVQEESVSNSSTCGKEANHPKISSTALMNYGITPTNIGSASSSTDQVKKVIPEKEEMNKTMIHESIEEPSSSLTKFRDNKGGQFFDGAEEHRRNSGADKRIAADPIIPDDEKKFDVLHRDIENDAISEYSYTKGDLTRIMEKWKEIFVGDIKELIRYLRMVDNYFQERNGKFTLSEFKEVFGELNTRWEFSDIDLIEMDIINFVHSLDKEHVLIVNPIIREMEFPEMVELAKEIYNLLSKLLQSMNSVKVEVIVRTLNFGINNRKTIDEKYILLWEVFSDSQFQDVFVIDVLQKQNKEHGFDVMVLLNPNLNLPRIFAE
ncbi:50S ribosomal protein [Dirofilaria immitis]